MWCRPRRRARGPHRARAAPRPSDISAAVAELGPRRGGVSAAVTELELDQEHAGEVDRGGDRRRRGADRPANGGDVVQTAPSSGRAAADISAAVAELELDHEHAGEVDRGDDRPSPNGSSAATSHALSGAACQADNLTHRRNAAMFLAIGALALPRSRRVAGLVTGDAADAAALSATAGDGVERPADDGASLAAAAIKMRAASAPKRPTCRNLNELTEYGYLDELVARQARPPQAVPAAVPRVAVPPSPGC